MEEFRRRRGLYITEIRCGVLLTFWIYIFILIFEYKRDCTAGTKLRNKEKNQVESGLGHWVRMFSRGTAFLPVKACHVGCNRPFFNSLFSCSYDLE